MSRSLPFLHSAYTDTTAIIIQYTDIIHYTVYSYSIVSIQYTDSIHYNRVTVHGTLYIIQYTVTV